LAWLYSIGRCRCDCLRLISSSEIGIKMTIGKSSLWISRLKDVDKELIKCIERVWPTVIARLSQEEKEDKITQRLVNLLRKDRGVCNLGFLNIHYKLDEEDQHGDFTTKGILDMALFLDQDYERYIAYECKRINTVDSAGKRIASLSGSYVEDGVIRYATAKYSEKLPYGCMLGYVMDGDMCFAIKQLTAAIQQRKDLIKCQTNSITVTGSIFPEFETVHLRGHSASLITVRHSIFSII
jgi:hypothetical protein